jgi:hypothetical protein
LTRTKTEESGESYAGVADCHAEEVLYFPSGPRVIVCRFEDCSEVVRAFPYSTDSMPGTGLDRNRLAAE